MVLTLYLDQVLSSGGGISKHPLFFLNFKRKTKSSGAILASGHLNSRKLSSNSKSWSHMAAKDKKAVNRPNVEREVRLHMPSLIFTLCFAPFSRQLHTQDDLSICNSRLIESSYLGNVTEGASGGVGCLSQHGVPNSVQQSEEGVPR